MSSITQTLQGVAVATQANVFFDGKCVSHTVTFADGSRKTVGVILQSSLTFGTQAPEIMEGTGGACEWRMEGETEWKRSGAGEKFSVPGNAKFEIRVSGEPYSYICHFG